MNPETLLSKLLQSYSKTPVHNTEFLPRTVGLGFNPTHQTIVKERLIKEFRTKKTKEEIKEESESEEVNRLESIKKRHRR